MISVQLYVCICIYEHQISKKLTPSPSVPFLVSSFFLLNIFYLGMAMFGELDEEGRDGRWSVYEDMKYSKVGHAMRKQLHLICLVHPTY